VQWLLTKLASAEKMPPINRKSTGNKFSILAICFIALVVFAMLSLYAMVTRQVTPENSTTSHKDQLFQKTISSLQQEILSLSTSTGTVTVTPPEKVTETHSTPRSPPAPVTARVVPPTAPVKVSITRPSEPQVLPLRNSSGLLLPTLHAVTYASHGGKDDRFCRAIESAVRHEVDLIILGWGMLHLFSNGMHACMQSAYILT
jgi:hypothetical protein